VLSAQLRSAARLQRQLGTAIIIIGTTIITMATTIITITDITMPIPPTIIIIIIAITTGTTSA
jgi:D-ribose pyranose/furanose isomerase RbsD